MTRTLLSWLQEFSPWSPGVTSCLSSGPHMVLGQLLLQEGFFLKLKKKKVHSNTCISYLFIYCCVTKDPKLSNLVAKHTFYCY